MPYLRPLLPLLLASLLPARAAVPAYASGETIVLMVAQADSATFQPKTVDRALLASLGWTFVPILTGTYLTRRDGSVAGLGAAVITFGYLFGPAMGNYYAGDSKRGTLGVLLRVGGGVTMFLGLLGALDEGLGGYDHPEAELLWWGGLAIAGGGVAWNLITIPLSVRDHNARGLSVAPAFDVGARGAGLSLAYRF